MWLAPGTSCFTWRRAEDEKRQACKRFRESSGGSIGARLVVSDGLRLSCSVGCWSAARDWSVHTVALECVRTGVSTTLGTRRVAACGWSVYEGRRSHILLVLVLHIFKMCNRLHGGNRNLIVALGAAGVFIFYCVTGYMG